MNHPNICQLYDLGGDGSELYAMELLEGESLATRLSRGPVPLGESVAISVATLSALEIGIRLALGATRRGIFRMILAESGRLVAAGLAIGLLAAVVLVRLVSSRLYGVSATDPWTLCGWTLLPPLRYRVHSALS